MTEKTPCSCGANEPKRIIFPCSGQANVGQLTNLAALRLTEEKYGTIACAALLAIGAETILANAKAADGIVVLDGCPMLCGKKIADAQGVAVHQHLVLTEMGIPKGPSKSYTEEDVENVVAACREGEGLGKNTLATGKKSGETHCGCGSR